MSRVTPTTKSCNQICRLITGHDCNQYSYYVQTTFDPTSTHALYGVRNDKASIDGWKSKIKEIGGKYIRVVGRRGSDYKVICFALEITPQEATQVKMQEEAKKREKAARESKLFEVNESIILQQAGATSQLGKERFVGYLLDSKVLDPLLPLESYVLMDTPQDKDEKRIYDIVQKANAGHPGCVGMVTTEKWKMIELASQMNKKITGEDKRLRRRAACLKYGLKFLADCFV